MNKLEKLEMMAKDLIKYYCPEYYFKWTSGKRTAGYCNYQLKQIGISKPISELNSVEEMLLTVTHEIAHALTRDGHSKEWKRVCVEIGGDGERCYSSENKLQPKRWILYHNGEATNTKRFRRFNFPLYVLDNYEWRKEN